jgi:hypothetical protein
MEEVEFRSWLVLKEYQRKETAVIGPWAGEALKKTLADCFRYLLPSVTTSNELIATGFLRTRISA